MWRTFLAAAAANWIDLTTLGSPAPPPAPPKGCFLTPPAPVLLPPKKDESMPVDDCDCEDWDEARLDWEPFLCSVGLGAVGCPKRDG